MTTASPVAILAWQRNINGHSALTAAAKVVATEISLHINSQTATAWPSIKRLAARTNLAIATVKRAVRQLVQLGLIALQRTGRSNRYRLIGLASELSDSSPLSHERTKDEGLTILSAEAAQIDAQTASDAPQIERDIEDIEEQPEQPATAQETAQQPSDAQDPDQITALIGYFYALSGTSPTAARHRKALMVALKSHTAAEIKQAADVAKSLWSNPAFVTPAAICKEGRIDELLSQGKQSTQGTKQAAHKPFVIDRSDYRRRTDEERQAAARGLAGLRAALAGAKAKS